MSGELRVDGASVRLVYGTTVLSCGCGIPWWEHHRRNKVLICQRGHGPVIVVSIR